jgi:cytidylate kinase
MAVITISRQLGSGGDQIAERICELSGYQRFDKHILARVAAEAGFSQEEIIDYSESDHKVQNFIDRLLGRTRPLAEVHIWRESADGVRVSEAIPISEEHVLSLTRMAIEAAYKEDHFVIVGRGGQVILKDRPLALHVRIEAPLEDRIQHVRAQPNLAGQSYGLSYENRRAAQDRIDASDQASADYLQRFYQVDWRDLSLYHLILNSARLTTDQAARLIVAAAESIEREKEMA